MRLCASRMVGLVTSDKKKTAQHHKGKNKLFILHNSFKDIHFDLQWKKRVEEWIDHDTEFSKINLKYSKLHRDHIQKGSNLQDAISQLSQRNMWLV